MVSEALRPGVLQQPAGPEQHVPGAGVMPKRAHIGPVAVRAHAVLQDFVSRAPTPETAGGPCHNRNGSNKTTKKAQITGLRLKASSLLNHHSAPPGHPVDPPGGRRSLTGGSDSTVRLCVPFFLLTAMETTFIFIGPSPDFTQRLFLFSQLGPACR